MRWSVVAIGFAGLCLGAGCRREAMPPAPPREASSGPRRVICGSPAVTEIVFALGCGDRVVGVSDYAAWPPEARQQPRIGGWINPSRERVIMLRPDLIIAQGRHELLAGFARGQGMAFQAVHPDSVDTICGSAIEIACALDVPQAGTNLAARIRAGLDEVRSGLAGAPARRVVLLAAHTPGDLTGVSTVGPGTFLGELIDVAGGSNVFRDVTGTYPQVSKEALLARRPEVILELAPGASEADAAGRVRDWARLGPPPGSPWRVEVLREDYLLIPGPRVVLIAERLARAIHPERMGE